MELLYGTKFSKDLDAIRHETKIKAELLKLIEVIRAADSLTDLKGVRKIEGYQTFDSLPVTSLERFIPDGANHYLDPP